MKRTLGFLLRCLVFAVLLGLVLSRINRTLEPKYYLHEYYWPTTPTYTQFYDLERDSVDLLFLGSSVAQNEFIPQALYNEFGIRACNLASERQSPMLSYYWLKEALNYQSPKLVVLEVLFLQNRYPEDPLNSSASLTRKALDPMRWSSVKLEAVRDLCGRYRYQRELSFLLTNIRYHERWPELEADDFDTDEYLAPRLYGWAPGVQEPETPRTPFRQSDADNSYVLRADMVEYLEKMAELCREKGVRLILVKTPQFVEEAPAIDFAYRRTAERLGLDFYNFTEETLYRQLELDPERERADDHGNLPGNQKVTRLMGELLTERYGLTGREDPRYEATRAPYAQICASYELPRTEDIDAYLRLLKQPGYAVLISVRDEAVSGMRDSTKVLLRELGITTNWTGEDMYRRGFAAVIDDGRVIVQTASERTGRPVTVSGSFHRGRYPFTITSAGYENSGGANSVIQIGDEDCSVNSRGLNIVVFDLVTQKVVDAVCFDTYADSACKR